MNTGVPSGTLRISICRSTSGARRQPADAAPLLLAAHRLWIEWLDEGRVRKLALVAERA
jgi:hypothetical protein